MASTACMFVLVFVGIKLTMPERPPQVPDIGVIGTSDSAGSDIAATTVMTSSPASTAPVQTAGTAAETVTATQTQAASSETRTVASTTTATSDEEGLSYLEDDVETETVTTRRTTAATTASRRTTSTVTSAQTFNAEHTTAAVTTAPQTTTVFVMTQAECTVVPETTAYPSVEATTPTFPAQIYERYRTVEVNTRIYTTKGWEAQSIEIGEQIGTAELVSNDRLMSCNATIYEYITQAEAFYKPVIIKFDGYDGYWIYSRN